MKLRPSDGSGYIQAARIQALLGRHNLALETLLSGLKAVDRKDARSMMELDCECSAITIDSQHRATENFSGPAEIQSDLDANSTLQSIALNPTDMMQRVPFEIIELIFSHVSLLDLTKWQHVSRLWRDNIRAQFRLWRLVDNHSPERKVMIVRKMPVQEQKFELSKYPVSELCIYAMVMGAPGDVEEAYCRSDFDSLVTTFEINANLCSMWNKLIGPSYYAWMTEKSALHRKIQYFELCTVTLDMPLGRLLSGAFPNVISFGVYSYWSKEPKKYLRHLKLNFGNSSSYVQHENIRQLIIDAECHSVLSQDFESMLKLCPNLQSLHWTNGHIAPLAGSDLVRLNLAHAALNLVHLNLSGTRMSSLPILPEKVQRVQMAKRRAVPRKLTDYTENKVMSHEYLELDAGVQDLDVSYFGVV
ncbi:uncharacterized protein V1518DRAFT_420372 [Limtongia smithiae]|uniref:uncharacterized protein n=1 Tax=Limtongia smithiae TaxID=1125753 RepID=UPI0034CF1D6C